MGDFVYLGWSLSLVLLSGVLLLVLPGERRPAILSAFLSAPAALYAPYFVPEYWQPDQIAHYFAGPEDFLFSFANGALIWVMAVSPMRSFARSTPTAWASFSLRYAVIALLFGVIMISTHSAGLRIMDAFVVGALVVLGVLLRLRPDLWRVSLRGAVSFGLFHTSGLLALLWIWPGFASQWSTHNLSGRTVFGAPLEETVWAALFGAVWPLVMCYLLTVQRRDVPDSDGPANARDMLCGY